MKFIYGKKGKTFFWTLLVLVVVVLVLAIGMLVGIKIFYKNNVTSPYYAIYIDTGDLYFGQMSYDHDQLLLSNVWYIQRDQQNNSSVVKFSDIVWEPTGGLRLNNDNVVWTTKISSDSQLMDVFNGKNSPGVDVKNNIGNTQSNNDNLQDQITQ